MIASVFFDLDGTLADTAPDLAAALNQALREQGQPALPLDTIKSSISLGSHAMVKLAFSIAEDDPEFSDLKERFLDIYQQRRHRDTHIFPGISAVLDYLENNNISWGVITNKPEYLTHPLMQRLQLTPRAACIISGDTTEHRKPHPAPVLRACEIAQCDPQASLYIGDALRDIEAGRAAGMKTLTADYGYINPDDDPKAWHANGSVAKPEDIIDWLKKENVAR